MHSHPIQRLLPVLALAAASIQPSPILAQNPLPPTPLLVTGMVHLDPLASSPVDSAVAITNYINHRDGVLWYIGLAAATGLRLSAQTTGVYAEACIRQGDWADFISFMPGGMHHLGTHIHPKVKHPFPYAWRELPAGSRNNPDSVRLVLADNIPWINTIFARNGYPAMANWFFHGASASYNGMDSLWCAPTSPPMPYPNCFEMGDGARGQQWIYLGPWGLEPSENPDTSYVKVPEVGGIIGHDEPHGPEGMVYGTVPYQKRDFLRAYMEWREMVRRAERSAVRHYTWMVHPYQLTPTSVGTDGRLVRESIAELVEWLGANWIGATDESGFVMAQYANSAQIRGHFASWRAQYPNEAQALQTSLQAGVWPQYLPALHERLESCFYVDRTAYPDTHVVAHEFEDHDEGSRLWAMWSRSGSRPLDPSFAGVYVVLHGDGTQATLPWTAITIEPEPVLLELVSASSLDPPLAALAVTAPIVAPHPVQGTSVVTFMLTRPSAVAVKLYDVSGRQVADIAASRYGAGSHSIPLATDRLRRGVYLLEIDAGGIHRSLKIVVAP